MDPDLMLTAGLLLSLKDGASSAAGLISRLREHPALLPGALEGNWLPVAMEAADDVSGRELHDWILAQPGVTYIDVVHVNFEPDDSISSKCHDSAP